MNEIKIVNPNSLIVDKWEEIDQDEIMITTMDGNTEPYYYYDEERSYDEYNGAELYYKNESKTKIITANATSRSGDYDDPEWEVYDVENNIELLTPKNEVFSKRWWTEVLDLHESPPIEFETDDYENYVNENRDKIEKAADVFNLPIQDMMLAFVGGTEVVLSDDIWSKLENSKSYKIKSLDEAIQAALKAGIDPKPYIDFIKEGKELPLPMVLCYAQDKYYLVGGDIILSLYRALGSIPTVLQGTLNLQTRQLHQPTSLGEELIKEYSVGLINKLIQKFKQEDPKLTDDEIKKVINRFDQVKDNVEQKDILRYNWDDLIDIVTSIEPKRIKAGKINNGEIDNADLVYNQNDLRVYKGKDKKACIRYGYGYTFCISARGEGNAYAGYRTGESGDEGTPALAYFVFDDGRYSEKDKNGEFIDPTHLLVVMVNEPKLDQPDTYYITEADNKTEDTYTWSEAVDRYPELEELKDVLKYEPPSDNDIDVKISKLNQQKEKEYEMLTKSIENTIPSMFESFSDSDHAFSIISSQLATDVLNEKYVLYKVSNVSISKEINVWANGKPVSTYGNEYFSTFFCPKEKIKNIEKWKKNKEKIYKLKITLTPIDINDTNVKQFFKDIIDLNNKYNKLKTTIKLQSLQENLNTTKDKHADIVKYFIKYAVKELGLKQLPTKITLSYDTDAAKNQHSFGHFDPSNDQIWVYVKDRNTADFLRTLAHELVHRKQAEDGRLEPGDGATGSDIENEANAQAGVLLRKFGKEHEDIYETLNEIRINNPGDYEFQVGDRVKEMHGDESPAVVIGRVSNIEAALNDKKNLEAVNWIQFPELYIEDPELANTPWYLIQSEETDTIYYWPEDELVQANSLDEIKINNPGGYKFNINDVLLSPDSEDVAVVRDRRPNWQSVLNNPGNLNLDDLDYDLEDNNPSDEEASKPYYLVKFPRTNYKAWWPEYLFTLANLDETFTKKWWLQILK